MEADHEFEELIRRVAHPPEPSRALRRQVRRNFLDPPQDTPGAASAALSGGTSEESAESTSRPVPVSRSSERLDTRLEHMLGAQPVATPANPEFRAELRRVFVEGAWEESASEIPRPSGSTGSATEITPEQGGASHGGAVRKTRPEGRRQGRLVRLFLPIAAAAAILFIAFLPSDPRWKIDFEGPGTVRLNGVAYGASDAQRLGAMLGRAGVLATDETALKLRLENGLVIRVRPGTEVLVGELDGDSPYYFSMEKGEIYISTRDDYTGNSIRVSSDLGDVDVVGTSLGVMCYEEGFCVCVSEGLVKARSARNPVGFSSGEWESVKANHRFYVPTDPKDKIRIEAQGDNHPHFADLAHFTQTAFQ